MAIHPTAMVEDGARLGAGVEIGPFCHVGARVRLDDGVRLLSHVVGHRRHTRSARARSCIRRPCWAAKARSAAMISPTAGWRSAPIACCAKMVSHECAAAARAAASPASARAAISWPFSHVGHDCHVGDDVTFANAVALGGHVEIGDGVIFGGLSAVQQFCRVGKGAMIGGLTGVNRDVIPYGHGVRRSCRAGGLNLIGLKRRGLPRATINAMRAAFRADFLRRAAARCSTAPAARKTRVARCGGSAGDRRFHPGRRQAADLPGARARGTTDAASGRRRARHHRGRRRAAARRGARARASAGRDVFVLGAARLRPRTGSRTFRTNGSRWAKPGKAFKALQ